MTPWREGRVGGDRSDPRWRRAARTVCLRVLVILVVAADLPAVVAAADDSTAASLDRTRIANLRDEQIVYRAALERIAPSVVRIDTMGGALPIAEREGPQGDRRTAPTFRQADGPTTGVIWSADGLVITSSFNFVREPSIITVTTDGGKRLIAKLVARDYAARLALLKIDADALPAADWLPADQLRSGQWALAAGFGHGSAQPALSVGIISGLGRMNGLAVQTDARISPANYGGPLFDIEGRAIGLCVPMAATEDQSAGVEWYDSGIGFAIPDDVLRERVARLAVGEDLRRGYLGVMLDIAGPVVGVAPSTDESTTQPTPDVAGVRVAAEPRGPAASAGLREGDIITAIDGVATPTLVSLRRQLARRAAGDSIDVTYSRDGVVATVSLVLAVSDDLAAPADEDESSEDGGGDEPPQ